MKKKEKNTTWEYGYMFEVKQEPQPKQLWYLAISALVVMAAFIALVII